MGLGNKSDEGLIGFLKTSDTVDDLVPELELGMLFDRKTKEPPWIVVDHDLYSMIIPNWPIKLWKVQVINPIEPQGHIGNYTRCSAIKALELLPSYKVFGETDTGIVDVIEFAQNLTLEQAKVLSQLRANTSDEIYSQAWGNWVEKNNVENCGNRDIFNGGSPIGAGLSLIYKVVFDQGGKEAGEYAYDYEEDGTPYLTCPWDLACSALLDAAMSFGANDLFDPVSIAETRTPLRQVSPELVNQIEKKLKHLSS